MTSFRLEITKDRHLWFFAEADDSHLLSLAAAAIDRSKPGCTIALFDRGRTGEWILWSELTKEK